MLLKTSFIAVLAILPILITTQDLPTLYEYYVNGPITSGLSADQSYFTLNGKNITIYSGAIHYFRVPPQYWRDRLRKMRAVGLNTIETYIPWNLHEFANNTFDFGEGGSEWQDFLDVQKFLQIVKEEDLFAIVRPGPYICAEFEFGGFPSWLLREKSIAFRQSDEIFMKYVTRYFNTLLPRLALQQFTFGGPIIAFQVENEYGSTKSDNFVPDKEYLESLRQLMGNNGIKELLVTSDSATGSGTIGTLPDYFLMTANFGGNPEQEFDALKQLQPNKPSMAMEYYPGWFDHWGEDHHTRTLDEVADNLERILKYPASFNLYMFHGGTNFGFLNGANLNNGNINDNSGFQPVTTSYDYDAPLTENGNYTEKYFMIKELLEKYTEIKTKLPEVPEFVPTVDYPAIAVQMQYPQKEIFNQNTMAFLTDNPEPMETLNSLTGSSGQSYGYITYRKSKVPLKSNSSLQITGFVYDTVMVLLNGELISPALNTTESLNEFGTWRQLNSTLFLSEYASSGVDIDIIVENSGRVGYGNLDQFKFQFKGINYGPLVVSDEIVTEWTSTPLEFSRDYTTNLNGWKEVTYTTGPGLYKSEFLIDDEPRDTYIDMSDWTKGIVIVNGIVLGRYWTIGPQQCLYLPAQFLKTGINTILVFEHYQASDIIKFSDRQIYLTK